MDTAITKLSSYYRLRGLFICLILQQPLLTGVTADTGGWAAEEEESTVSVQRHNGVSVRNLQIALIK